MRYFLKYLPRRLAYSIWNKEYHIKRGYVHRVSVPHYDDTDNKDEWQDGVYAFAKEVFTKNFFTSVLDIGCGSAYKLFKYFDEVEFTGVEVEPTLSFLRNKYSDQEWLYLEQIRRERLFDLVILSDVIEHIERPDEFLRLIKKRIKFKYLIISTPERDLIKGKYNYGPPTNKHHYREWNKVEFNKFISDYFIINKHFYIHNEGIQVIKCSPIENDGNNS